MTVSQHAQYQDPETKAAEYNSAMIDITYTYAFPTETCQNVFVRKAFNVRSLTPTETC